MAIRGERCEKDKLGEYIFFVTREGGAWRSRNARRFKTFISNGGML